MPFSAARMRPAGRAAHQEMPNAVTGMETMKPQPPKGSKRPRSPIKVRKPVPKRASEKWLILPLLAVLAGVGFVVLRPHFAAAGPESARLLRSADELLEQGDTKAALAKYDEVIVLEPDSESAYVKRGDARLLAQDLTGAVLDYTAAIERTPGKVALFQKRADAYRRPTPVEESA